MELAEISEASIAKWLASCKQSSRNRAVRLLCSWIPSRSRDLSSVCFSDADLIKIWKGLFFCVWHSDKLANQVELINRLSSLLSSLPPQLACRYLESFLITIRREWSGIDLFRLDKFYLLIRRFLRHAFALLKKNSWNLELSARMVDLLTQGSLLSADKFSAAGVNYHIAEIFLDELVEFLPLDKEALDLMLSPFISVMQGTTDKVLVNKIKVNIFDRLAVNGSNLLTNVESGGDVEKFGKIALAMGFSKIFFSLASAAETHQGNRKVLFGLHDRYLKLENEVEKSGLSIPLNELDDGCSVPESERDMETAKILTTNFCCDNGLVKKKEKKKKANKTLDETGTNGKVKKKKKFLDSSTESNGVDQGKINKDKNMKKKSAESNAEETTIKDSKAIDTLFSNLQKQFEKVAVEAGMATAINAKVPKKRKRAKKIDNKHVPVNSENVDEVSETGKNTELNVKKVRFSMNNNLIWKPQNPLPPQNLRLPPSATPRGSALKKGLSPGPIRESPTIKTIKVKGSSLKKGRKTKKLLQTDVSLQILYPM